MVRARCVFVVCLLCLMLSVCCLLRVCRRLLFVVRLLLVVAIVVCCRYGLFVVVR